MDGRMFYLFLSDAGMLCLNLESTSDFALYLTKQHLDINNMLVKHCVAKTSHWHCDHLHDGKSACSHGERGAGYHTLCFSHIISFRHSLRGFCFQDQLSFNSHCFTISLSLYLQPVSQDKSTVTLPSPVPAPSHFFYNDINVAPWSSKSKTHEIGKQHRFPIRHQSRVFEWQWHWGHSHVVSRHYLVLLESFGGQKTLFWQLPVGQSGFVSLVMDSRGSDWTWFLCRHWK